MEPRTLGDHLRRRRLDLGLLQVEVAAKIGVTESTVWNWEHGTHPELVHIPAVIDFLGYIPWEEPGGVVERLSYFKKVKGLSFQRLGVLMGRDAAQLTAWLSGRVKPSERNVQIIIKFLRINS